MEKQTLLELIRKNYYSKYYTINGAQEPRYDVYIVENGEIKFLFNDIMFSTIEERMSFELLKHFEVVAVIEALIENDNIVVKVKPIFSVEEDQKNILIAGNHEFEIVDSFPQGYDIWSIGDNMPKGYLPLYKDNGDFHVDPDTLKAIKVEGAEYVLKVACYSKNIKTIKGMETYIKRYSKSKNAYTRLRVERVKKALEVLKTVKFD